MALPDMVGITVKDISKSIKFYRLLGLDIPEPHEGDDYVECITPNGYRISWNSESLAKSLDPEWQEPCGQRIGIAFKCANPAEVDSLYQTVINAGYSSSKAPWDAFWGQRYAVVLDPDGTLVDLFAPL